MKEKTVEEFLPLNPARYWIMSSLINKRHGYGIIRHVEQISDGEVKLGVPTLYENLKRLKADGLVEPAGETTLDTGEVRKLLRLSGKGQQVLAADERQRRKFMVHNGPALGVPL